LFLRDYNFYKGIAGFTAPPFMVGRMSLTSSAFSSRNC